MHRTHIATMRTLRRNASGVRVSIVTPECWSSPEQWTAYRAQNFIFVGLLLRTAETFLEARPDWGGWKRGGKALNDYRLKGGSQKRDRRLTDEDVELILDNMRSGISLDELIAVATGSCAQLAEVTHLAGKM